MIEIGLFGGGCLYVLIMRWLFRTFSKKGFELDVHETGHKGYWGYSLRYNEHRAEGAGWRSFEETLAHGLEVHEDMKIHGKYWLAKGKENHDKLNVVFSKK